MIIVSDTVFWHEIRLDDLKQFHSPFALDVDGETRRLVRPIMSSETKIEETSEFKWMQVREAITQRWPHINRDELADCPNDEAKLTDFVQHRVEASDEEVRSVVGEFAPHESMVDRAGHVAGEQWSQAGEAAQLAYMRADECIAARPTESVLASFVAGIVIGATVTALFMQSTPEPTLWDRAKEKPWS